MHPPQFSSTPYSANPTPPYPLPISPPASRIKMKKLAKRMSFKKGNESSDKEGTARKDIIAHTTTLHDWVDTPIADDGTLYNVDHSNLLLRGINRNRPHRNQRPFLAPIHPHTSPTHFLISTPLGEAVPAVVGDDGCWTETEDMVILPLSIHPLCPPIFSSPSSSSSLTSAIIIVFAAIYHVRCEKKTRLFHLHTQELLARFNQCFRLIYSPFQPRRKQKQRRQRRPRKRGKRGKRPLPKRRRRRKKPLPKRRRRRKNGTNGNPRKARLDNAAVLAISLPRPFHSFP